MLAGVQRCLDLPAVLGGGRDDGDGVDIRLREHLAEIGVHVGDTQLLLRVFQLRRNDGAGCGQLGVRDFECDVVGVNLAQTAEACVADFDLFPDNTS